MSLIGAYRGYSQPTEVMAAVTHVVHPAMTLLSIAYQYKRLGGSRLAGLGPAPILHVTAVAQSWRDCVIAINTEGRGWRARLGGSQLAGLLHRDWTSISCLNVVSFLVVNCSFVPTAYIHKH